MLCHCFCVGAVIEQISRRMDTGKYSFVNRTIKDRNQLPEEALGTFPCKPKIFGNRVRKAIINGVKCSDCSDVR